MNAAGRWNDLNGIVDGSLLSSQADAESKCQSLQREKKWKLAKVDCFSQLLQKEIFCEQPRQFTVIWACEPRMISVKNMAI